jgi:hypothetical protein
VFLPRPELSDAWDLRVLLEVSSRETPRRAVALEALGHKVILEAAA